MFYTFVREIGTSFYILVPAYARNYLRKQGIDKNARVNVEMNDGKMIFTIDVGKENKKKE